MNQYYDVLVVGAGHGGAQTAIALRQGGFLGSVAIAGEEPDLPYERPPLSKEYLSGGKPFDRILIRQPDFWADREVVMLTGCRITAVDPIAQTVLTQSGTTIGYGDLVWAAGGHARRLSCEGYSLAGVHTVRTRADVDRMIGEIPHVRHAVVIGGGFIGLEAAAVLTKFDKNVVLLEALDRIMARVAAPPLSAFFQNEHERRGVEIKLCATVDCIIGTTKVEGVLMAGGEIVPADLVIVGIGIVPAVEPLIAAGAEGGNGVRVDSQCRTTLPHVFAVGDCALHVNRFSAGMSVRIESVQNATDQATIAAKAILGEPVTYQATPWFWSHQYDLKLQTIGLSTGYDEIVVRGNLDTRSFSIVHLKEGRVIALDCVNATKDYVQGRRLVEAGAEINPRILADSSKALKDMV